MIRKSHLLATILSGILTQAILAQDIKEINQDELTKDQKAALGLLVGRSSYPVIYGKDDDGFPTRMRVRGVIEEVTFVPFACGVICWSGTAKIRLIGKIRNYTQEYAYVAVRCLLGKREDYLQKRVDIRVTKLREKKDDSCGSIVNSINSNGVAFYRFDDGAFKLKVFDQF